MREATAEFWATFILVVSIQQRSEMTVKKWAKPRRYRRSVHMGPCEQGEEEKNLDTAGKRAAALASSLGIFSYPNEKNMIKESLKQKPKHLLHVF